MPQSATGLFPVTDSDRHAKGRQKMHGLALYTKHVWETSRSFDTSLCKGPQPDSELLSLDIAPALAAIRTLDLEVIRNSQRPADQQRYLDLQDTDPQGQVVRGLVLPRNADVHLPAALNVHPEVALGDVSWRVVPIWQPYTSLPHIIRTSTGTKPSSHAAYRDAVGGHRVVETLLDAFAFFQRCDPSLARREPRTGALSYFPLAGPMVVLSDYERRHPDHLNRREMASRALQLAQDGPPAGPGREIQYRLTINDTVLYYGHTGPQPTMREFTEPGQQIVRDIQASYPYSVVDAAGARHTVTVGTDGQLYADGQLLERCPLRERPTYLTELTATPSKDPEGGLWYWDERRGDELYPLQAELGLGNSRVETPSATHESRRRLSARCNTDVRQPPIPRHVSG
ncbi:hypothetical protein ACFWWT_42520 [Streptomyces sp. NPDC058676]|uniref:hypothetical protein n=1 Tax=unclassified Streptomyces TaxID=2593676 RepID=UPI003659A0C8